MTRSSISRFVCLILLTTTPAIAAAQTGTISGRVTDSTTSAPMSGATVRAISGTTTAGTANVGEDGTYRIVNLAAGQVKAGL